MKPRQRSSQIRYFWAAIVGLLLLTSCEGQIVDIQLETEDPDQARSTGTVAISSSEPSLTPSPNPSEPAPSRTLSLTRPDTVRETYAAETAQKASRPSSTPRPVATHMPQSDAGVPLTSEGTWLLYSSDYGAGEWYIVNADGSGRT